MLTPVESAYEKLDQAVYNLVTGAGDIRERLRFAGLEVLLIRTAGLPAWLRDEVDAIAMALTGGIASGGLDGTIDATLRQMHLTAGVRIAQKIYELRNRVRSSLGAIAPNLVP
jgi:hypothetical protein